jgi:hypothetical protein
VPLSEEELRLLEQMERALVAEDPKLASALRGTFLRAHARRRAFIAVVFFLLGVGALMAGEVLTVIPLAVAGFVVMLLSATVALTAWRSQSRVPEPAPVTSGHHQFQVVEGGRSARLPRRLLRRGPRPARTHHSLMERFEERWRRRREQSGY